MGPSDRDVEAGVDAERQPVRIEVTATPDPADLEQLEDRLHAATVAATGHADLEPLAAFVRDATGSSVIAGISGWTWGGTCELQSLWVDPGHRGRGLGRRLLVDAAAEAARRGCHQVVLFTHEIEAPGLYDRLGYELVGRVDDYPTGGAASWYRKPLGDADADDRPA